MQANCRDGYLFANARASRIKLLVHDGFGVWCAARRLNIGSFEWPRGAASATDPGVVFDFCLGRGAKYPLGFLTDWTGTLVVDAYAGYGAALALEGRSTAYCVAHARRKFDELFKANASPVAAQAIQRIAWLYRIEADARDMPSEERLRTRQERTRPLWEALHVWLKLERTRLPTQLNSRIEELLPHRWQPAG